MMIRQQIEVFLARYPVAAAAAYFALIVALVFTTMDGVLQIMQRRDAVAAASEILERIDGRDPAPAPAAPADVSVPTGSPLLERARLTVPGGEALSHVATAAKGLHANTRSDPPHLLLLR